MAVDRSNRPSTLRDLTCVAIGCGRVLGRTDGKRLWMATSIFTYSVTLFCRYCGQRNAWSPAKGTNQ